MAITVNFYTFQKRINSTMRPDQTPFPALSPAASYDCILKAGCDVMSPVLSLDIGISSNPTALNYAYIADFNRYYFVRTWQWEERLWHIYLEEDVLATWKTNINAASLYVLRSASTFDTLLTDELYPTKPGALNRNIQASTNPWTYNLSNGRFVVGIINKELAAMGGVSYYVMTNTQFRAMCRYLMNNTGWLDVPADILDGGLDENLLKTLFNPIQYVASVKWYPFTPPTTGSVSDLPYGWWDLEDITASSLDLSSPYTASFTFTLGDHPQSASRGSYLNCAPYTRLTLSAGPFGEIVLDPNDFQSGTVYADLIVDCVSGIGRLMLSNTITGNPTFIVDVSADMGVNIQISQMGVDRLTQAETIITGALDVTAGTLQTAAQGVNITNLVNPLGGALSTAASGAQTVSTGVHAIANGIRSSLPQMSTTGINGSISSYYVSPYIKQTFYELVPEDNTENGRPLSQMKVLNTLSGYVLARNGDVMIPGTINEHAAVKAYLEGGCFLE